MLDPVPSVRMPANPNAVVFSASAAVVFERRPWGRIQELAHGPLLVLHQACGLPASAGFGWRVGLDRKNRRTLNVTMFFVVDGAVTAEHIDMLEQSMAHNPVDWGKSHIERIPVNGIVSLFANDGACFVLAQGTGGLVERLVHVDEALRVENVDPELALADDGRMVLPVVTGTIAPYDEADREMEQMRLAFAHRFAQRIMEADGVVQENETRFMNEVFRPEVMERLGLNDDDAREACFVEASRELPMRLGYHDKLALIGLFFSACYSDGTVDAREMRVLKDAAEALGVEKERVVNYLQRYW